MSKLREEAKVSEPSRNMLLPLGGVRRYPAPEAGKDGLANRFFRHYHTLYGAPGHSREKLHTFLREPVGFFKTNPYWNGSSKVEQEGLITNEWHNNEVHVYLGLLDWINFTQPLSMLAIAAHRGLLARAHNASEGILGTIAKYLYKTLAFIVDVVLRFPLGVAATLTSHAFDAVKWVASMAIAAVTATISQIFAEFGYAALAGYKGMPDIKAKVTFWGSSEEANPETSPLLNSPRQANADLNNAIFVPEDEGKNKDELNLEGATLKAM